MCWRCDRLQKKKNCCLVSCLILRLLSASLSAKLLHFYLHLYTAADNIHADTQQHTGSFTIRAPHCQVAILLAHANKTKSSLSSLCLDTFAVCGSRCRQILSGTLTETGQHHQHIHISTVHKCVCVRACDSVRACVKTHHRVCSSRRWATRF